MIVMYLNMWTLVENVVLEAPINRTQNTTLCDAFEDFLTPVADWDFHYLKMIMKM